MAMMMSKLVDRILSLVEERERANTRERGKGKVSARYWSPGEKCAMMRMQSIGLPDLVSLTTGRCVSTFIASVVFVFCRLSHSTIIRDCGFSP